MVSVAHAIDVKRVDCFVSSSIPNVAGSMMD